MDLNLLVALEFLIREKNVTRAAARLGVTQSAMSHTLNRLRAHFEDPLLVRKGAEMVATPLGEKLAADLGPILTEVESIASRRSKFDPKTAVRRFTILASDYAQVVVIPALLEKLPSGIDLAIKTAIHPERALAERGHDLMIGPSRDEASSTYRQKLFTDRLVCVGRRVEDLDDYLRAKHVLVSPRGFRGGIVDDVLATMGKERRIVLEVPHFLVAPMVIAKSDLVLTLPERLARALDLETFPLPLEVPEIEFVQLWHARNHDDEAHVWLRGLVATASRPARS